MKHKPTLPAHEVLLVHNLVGFGFLALLVPLITVFATTAMANAAGGPLYSAAHHWPGALGALLGAGLFYLLSLKLNTPGRQLIDPATGQQVVLRKRHTLFWIPLQFWAVVIAVAGIVYLFVPPSANTPAASAQVVPFLHGCATTS